MKNGDDPENGNADFPELGPEEEITISEFAEHFLGYELQYYQKEIIKAFCIPRKKLGKISV